MAHHRSISFLVVLASAALACSDDARGPGADVAPDVGRDVLRDAADAPADPTPDPTPDTVSDDAPADSQLDDALEDGVVMDLPADSVEADGPSDTGGADAAEVGGGDLPIDGAGVGDLGGGSVPLAGFGAIDGPCGVLDDSEWSAAEMPFLFVNQIDFGGDAYDDSDLGLLSGGGQEIIADGNLSASSIISEVFAYEVLYRCELATLLKSETEIVYVDSNGPKTDMLVRIDGRQIGVSVTRAHPAVTPFDYDAAEALLLDKLQGVVDSTANIDGEDAWVRQILVIMAADQERVDRLEEAYAANAGDIELGTIVIVTRTDGADDPIYYWPP